MYIIYDGIASATMHVRITKLPAMQRAPERSEEVKVPGRNGTLTLLEGERRTYDAYSDTFEGVLLPGADEEAVKAWLSGGGFLTTSNNPDRRRRVQFNDAISFDKIIHNSRHRRFKASVRMQPFLYEFEPTQATYYLSPGYILNPGTVESEPTITVFGNGDITVTVNESRITLTGISRQITINSELGDAYSGGILMNHKMQGDFPILELGRNTLQWTGAVDRVEIFPQWRWK